jgi:predicted ATPase
LARADETTHAPTRASVCYHFSLYQVFRGDPEAARRTATIPVDWGREHGMAFWLALGEVHSNWARAWLEDRESGMTGLREALAAYLGRGNKMYVPLIQGRLAELEAEGQDGDGALRRIDEAMALASEAGEHWTDALLHRIRGATLLKRDPTNSSPAEEAFQTAIAIAQAQKARSFELQAALALAKLYQSTGHPADAHALLAPAFDGFSPTPEMPQIAEAQELLAALAEIDEVKAALAQRDRRLHLQTAYGQAVMYSRGFASHESKTAFAHARTLAARVSDASERFDAYYGLFAGSVVRGEHGLARETAENFLREAKDEERMTEAAVARRNVGAARLWQGDLIGAEANLAEALRLYDRERDHDAKFRFGADTGAAAAAFLALAIWALSDVERARVLGAEALSRADETAHTPTRAQSNWARARLGDRESGMMGLREALATYLGQEHKLFAPLFHGLLAELEAQGDDAEAALTRIDQALALANETGERWTDAALHRIRGEILVRRDPGNPAPAEKPSKPPSQSRRRRRREASNCKRCWRSRSSTYRQPAWPRPTPSSPPRSKASRRHPKCPRSPKRRRCYQNWRRPPLGGEADFPLATE